MSAVKKEWSIRDVTPLDRLSPVDGPTKPKAQVA